MFPSFSQQHGGVVISSGDEAKRVRDIRPLTVLRVGKIVKGNTCFIL